MTLIYLLRFSRTLHLCRIKLSIKSLLLTLRNIGYMIKLGSSAFISEASIACMMFLGNYVFIRHLGEDGVAAFSIACYFFPIIFMVYNAIAQSAQPIISYNFGAGQHARVIKTLKLTIIYATCVTTFGFIVGMLFSDWVVSIFTSDAELIALSAKGLRIVVMFFPIIGFQMVTANFFQSIGMASKAIFLSLTRQMMVLLPCLIILPRFFGVAGVWYSMPISDLLASLIAGTMLVWQLRKFKAQA